MSVWACPFVVCDNIGLSFVLCSPVEPKVKAYGQMVAYSTLIACSIICAVWTMTSISRLRLGKLFGCEVPRTLWGKMQ